MKSEMDAAKEAGPDTSVYRLTSSQSDVPTVEFTFSVTVHCELLEGDVAALDTIAGEFASYLQRRDDQIGLVAARDWALLVDRVTVDEGAGEPGTVVDMRRKPQ